MSVIIGITGGFSAGKTTVAKYFKKRGAYVIDADAIVHKLYKTDKRISWQLDIAAELLFAGQIYDGSEILKQLETATNERASKKDPTRN